MSQNLTVGPLLEQIAARCPAGFAIALHIHFTSPKYLFQSYDHDWIEVYSREGLVMRDPTVRWGFEHTGTIRWSVLARDDDAGVLALAAGHGLKFGFTAALLRDGTRSIASFARADREFTDAEIKAIAERFETLHAATQTAEALSPAEHAALKRMSVLLTHG